MARPTKLRPEVRDAIFRSIEAGAYPEQAAVAAGIGRSTFYDWMRRGEAGARPYAEFSDGVRAREARAEAVAATVLTQAAAAGDWRAAAHFLERRFPDRWSRQRRFEAGPEALSDRIDPRDAVDLDDPEVVEAGRSLVQAAARARHRRLEIADRPPTRRKAKDAA